MDWLVAVPTRADDVSAARIEQNIVARLPTVPIVVIRNGRVATPARWNSLIERPHVHVLDWVGGGAARARNVAIASLNTRTIVFVDDDVIVSHSALRTLVERQRADGATVTTARVVPAGTAHHQLFDDSLGFDRGHGSRLWHAALPRKPLSPMKAWQFGVGAAFAVDLPLLHGSDTPIRFDERLSNGRFCGGSEDVDFFYSLYLAGHRLSYATEAVVEHVFPLSKAAVSAKCRQYALSDGAFYAKWANRISAADMLSEVVGWCRRLGRTTIDIARRRPAVPFLTLLAEPLYKVVGGMTWVLVRRQSS